MQYLCHRNRKVFYLNLIYKFMRTFLHSHLWISFLLMFGFGVIQLSAQSTSSSRRFSYRDLSSEFIQSDEARRIGDQILLYQRNTGGWPKNIDMSRELSEDEREQVKKDKTKTTDSTIDNGATTQQMYFLAGLYQTTLQPRYKEGFLHGLDYLLSGQYENGGWPQIWPGSHGYHLHITYNDNAIYNILKLFQAVIDEDFPYGGDLVDDAMRGRLKKSFDLAIECILESQIKVNGKPTVWCQQYDEKTLLPASARAFELPSYCSSESAPLVRLLMSLPDPDKRVKEAVHAAMKWFDTYKLTGLRYTRSQKGSGGQANARLYEDPEARPIWARYYDLQYSEPFVCDRDGLPRRRLEQIGTERRNGYKWFDTAPASLYAQYNEWADKYDKKHKLRISLDTPGANKTGKIDLYRKPAIKLSDFDVVVKAGESIQKAIEKAPDQPEKPFKIFVKNGIYNQKVIIDKPNIVLVGEDKDSTRIFLAETSKTIQVPEYRGKKIPMGVIVLMEEADHCLISNLTVYNNYGTTVEPTTAHQMAIFGRATHTIILNCNVWSDGNDALALWAPEGNGMYYHADLELRSPGVDFLCPRGWCYVTRSKFIGDGRAMIWHDGRGDMSKKLVIKDSEFDAKNPTILGRYHHDHQVLMLNCHLSQRIMDTNIQYAYTDKVLDPCPWGNRVYFYNCTRQGGHGNWMDNNLDQAEGKPFYHTVTAQWTFNKKWDPEQEIRDLWYVVAY